MLNKILIMVLIGIVFLSVMSCKKREATPEIVQYIEPKTDSLQNIIIKNYAPSCSEEYKIFATYDKLWEDQDTFYRRVYLEAYVIGIRKDLDTCPARSFPMIIIYDLEKNQMVRHDAPFGKVSMGDVIAQFPLEIRKTILNRSQEEEDEKMGKMYHTAIEMAKSYYQIKDEKTDIENE